MDTNEFCRRGREMVDYIADYQESISTRRVTPAIEPGYLRFLLPREPPVKGEKWEAIMADVDRVIMPGITHWQHPRFHAYFPAGNSYPSILADMLSAAIGCVGFSWVACPACTELDTIVLDWLGTMIGLPEDFLFFSNQSKGGGVIQTSVSESVVVCLLTARSQAIKALKEQQPSIDEGVLLSKLVAYCSKESHACIEKAAIVCFVKLRTLDTDDLCSMKGETVRQAMEEDTAAGLHPFFLYATLGTTSTCAFDNLAEIGPVCRDRDVWLHVDAAYAGSAFICPEFKYLMTGVEYASSFATNPHKWLLVNVDCSTMWIKDRFKLIESLVVDPLILKYSYSDRTVDYRHWGIPLTRRWRSLKLWFVIRNYGIEGLQAYIREHCRLAKRFESHLHKDRRFEIVNEVILGLVCFRLKGSDSMTKMLLTSINASGKLFMVPTSVNDKYVIRFCVVYRHATDDDIDHAWRVISQFATDLLEISEEEDNRTPRVKMGIKGEEDDDATEVDERHKLGSFFVRMVSDLKTHRCNIRPGTYGRPRVCYAAEKQQPLVRKIFKNMLLIGGSVVACCGLLVGLAAVGVLRLTVELKATRRTFVLDTDRLRDHAVRFALRLPALSKTALRDFLKYFAPFANRLVCKSSS